MYAPRRFIVTPQNADPYVSRGTLVATFQSGTEQALGSRRSATAVTSSPGVHGVATKAAHRARHPAPFLFSFLCDFVNPAHHIEAVV